ncbi:putative white-brown complex homolog protein 30 [Malania oleifera]|uniref:putative white-brown complex homolog protein 30 n=1 Tax=Malania oleifera TaxID=397392 RepID=UPI0025AE6E5A|nr:putative white-brown complex homolog protein 30 [Malania oleifera]
MRGVRINVNISWVQHGPLFLFFIILSLPLWAQCVDENDYSETGNPAVLPLLTQFIYGRLSNLTASFNPDITARLGFCIKDVDADWNGAFNFTGNLDFLTSCVRKTKGNLMQRLCTAAEIKFYFNSFFEKGSTNANYLRPNTNCNLTSWVPGCEPGWSCSVGANQKVDLKDSKNMPERTLDCQPCCEGFFSPPGITCMIPCPLGSYCPLATLNKTTGVCDPYRYQLRPGETNHTCGGADIWADVGSSGEVFCSAGSYCPTTTKKVPCSSGHYCRMGSTSEKPCFKLSTCNPNTANQNIHAYGIILIAALSTILLIVYSCSDQVLTTRERRQAKSREAAARSARETAQARERWKSAKDVAKKGAMGLQAQLSRTFSRAKSTRQQEQMKMLGKAKSKANDHSFLPPVHPGASEQSSSSGLKAKKKEPSNLIKMMHSIENNPNDDGGFNLDIGDKNVKKQMPKGRQLHTHSQIFKYAYGQLEKEKAMQEQNKNLTFSGVISMATDVDIKSRPVIEVDFKDLTLTLKGKNKHLLRCVTGKIMPGRVSAVMGPSGAGKTTFLSALAGKATGCTVTGLVLINGKAESIHSYKKIIGFVPQDDIVHGNLTVEENLRFSARCRLSADMPKPDKVLVVERVIESLGLQAVRDSLVGTVEKRGISGGQRKRVNVGLEMVMDPSLLILDEPTSGLDSSSSQLLLRALRREALEGVNICMVVHQPSYALFKMFDDLILLAKGGLTVYHGSVKKVEEYFTSLGITVPERVNPPDYFIDILEGIVKPNSGATHQQLPIRWMLHNGYPIPPDMLQLADGIATSSNDTNANSAATSTAPEGTKEQSFAGDLWRDLKCNVQLKRDSIQHNFLKSKDLSNRTTAGISRQYRYFLGRVGKQRLREAKIQVADYLILLLAGACLGTLAKVSDETFGALGYTYTVIAISLLCKISALRSFSLDKLHYWRESSSGMSSLAYFLSKDTIDHFNTIVKPLVYLSMFYFFNNPRSSFADNYIVLVCLVYCVTGIAYAFAILFEPGPAQLWSVLLPVVLTLIASQEKKTGFVKHIANLCYTKWALEAFVTANAERYSGVWLITRCGSLMQSGYDLHDWGLCILSLILAGIVSRFVAFFCMVTLQKK